MQSINVNNRKVFLEFYKTAFKGRPDVVARYYKSKKGSGYAPICANMWQNGICQQPEKSCRNCPNKDYVPLNDDLLIKHLEGGHILGVYPLLANNSCWFMAFDFDNHDGSHDPFTDVKRFYDICEVQEIPCYLLRSKSGTGYHCYIFFDKPMPAWKARLVGFALLQEAQVVEDDTTISSFDKLFPCQDELTPTRPLGNLIGMPFQGKAAKDGHTLFLNPGTDFQEPFLDQLEALQSITRVTEAKLDEIIQDWGLAKESPQQQKPLKSKAAVKLFTSAAKGKITQGSRNATLASEAGSLRRRGMEHEEIKEALLLMNQDQCEPPLEVSEVESIARSISNYPPDPEAVDQEKILASAKETLAGLADKVKSDPAAAFEASILVALRVVQEKDLGEWARLRKMFQEAKVPLRDLTKAMKQAGAQARAVDNADGDGQSSPAHPYCLNDGVLTLRRRTPDGVVLIPLCNFNAYVVGEKILDDGFEKTSVFEISGTRQNGQPLPAVQVPAALFARLSWVTNHWGAQAVMYAGQGIQDHLRAAIQLLSGEVIREIVYACLGWLKIGDEWIYLHGGGGISKDGLIRDLSVSLGDGRMKDYILPEPPTGQQLKKALRASLRLLDLAPVRIMFPLIAATYRAPLGEIVPIDFSTLLAGSTGTQKSELSAQVQAHFGAGFHGKNLPGNWYGTANALEKQAFLAKDAIFTVDDFAPAGTTTEVQSMHSKADRLLRGQGNRTGRARMKADGTLRHEYYPRGLILTSGEDIPQGQSLRGRMMILELTKGDVDLNILSEVQRAAADGFLAQSMSAYLQWLAIRFDQLKEELPDLQREYRTMAREKLPHLHDRTPEIVASLMVGLSVLARFAGEVGVFTPQESDEFLERGLVAIMEAAKAQGQHQASEDVVNRFLRLLAATISSGRAHFASAKSVREPKDSEKWGWRRTSFQGEYLPMGNCIGWVDDQYVYLDPDSAFAEVQKLAHSQGSGCPIKQNTLWRRLAERGLLASTDPGRNTLRETIVGVRKRIIHLTKDSLGVEGQVTVVDEVILHAREEDSGSWTKDLAQEYENPDKVVH
jgi:hypothetical protein